MNIYEKFIDYINLQGWKFHVPEDNDNIIVFGIKIESGKLNCVLDIDQAGTRAIFFSFFPVIVTETKRSQMSELITRINYSIFLGGFDMDFEDGEIRFKTSIIYDDCDLTESVIDHLIRGNIATMSKYFELLNSFITEKLSREEVIIAINTKL